MDEEVSGLMLLVGTLLGVGVLILALTQLDPELMRQVSHFLAQRPQNY